MSPIDIGPADLVFIRQKNHYALCVYHNYYLIPNLGTDVSLKVFEMYCLESKLFN